MIPINKNAKYTIHILNKINVTGTAKLEHIQNYILSKKDVIKFDKPISNKKLKDFVLRSLSSNMSKGLIVPVDSEIRNGQVVITEYKIASNVFCENGEWFKGELENV